MGTLVFPIAEGYVRSWGVWEMVREIVQNGLDEDDQGRTLSVEHDGEYLRVRNLGADMDGRAMLLGYSDKGPEQRGRHGEGLNLAMLVAARMGLAMEVETRNERWVPYIGMSAEYGGRVLCVRTQRLRRVRDGVTVRVRIPAVDWEGVYRERFLKFVKWDVGEEMRSYAGAVLMRPEFRGRIYVRGIYVMEDASLCTGFDFQNVELDRDRSVLAAWSVQYAAGEIWQTLVGRVEGVAAKVFQLAMEDAPEVGGFTYMSSLKETVARQFKERFGADAVPVLSTEDSARVVAAGRRPVVVPQRMHAMLVGQGVADAAAVLRRHGSEVRVRYAAEDLTEGERGVLAAVEAAIRGAQGLVGDLRDACRAYGVQEGWAEVIWPHVVVSEFNDERIEGEWERIGAGCVVYVARRMLASLPLALPLVVHEFAHHATGSTDGALGHTRAIEELWTLLYFVRQGEV
jgi:hypothetical protein